MRAEGKDRIVICKNCHRPEYWGEMRWLNGKCTCHAGLQQTGGRIKMGLLEMVREYNELLDEKDGLKEATKKNNEAIDEKKKEIAQQMIDDDVPSISVGGYKFFLQDKTIYSKKSEEALMAAGLDFLTVLREQGLGDIIQETVNTRTLQSTVKNLVEETGSLPEDLAEVLNVYDTYEIGRRKETNKAAKKAKGGN